MDAAEDSVETAGRAEQDTAPGAIKQRNSPKADGYVSVIYVHGIGSQRRYEETSRLIDQLDRYLHAEHERDESKGMLKNIRVRVEPLRAPSKSEIVGYVRTVFTDLKPGRPSVVRFYELYWAPVMAEVKSPWSVLRWLFKQPLRPWHTAFSPWRERQRLRRASLVALFEPGRRLPEKTELRDCGQLLELYDDFEGLPAQRSHPKGTFDEFLIFIGTREANKPDRMARHLALAAAWKRAYRLEEIRNAVVLSSLALALLLLALGSLVGTYQLLHLGVATLAAQLQRAHISLTTDWKTAAGLLASLAGLLGLGKALTDYLGDVEAWATYEETDVKHIARSKVLDEGMELLTHVLNDEACTRATIVSHSLGTSIALDTVLALRQLNLARDSSNPMSAAVRLDKIDHFVTMGSPIDKIEYFFESYCSPSHRYKRVIEALRGDIDSDPFSHAQIPHIHWINFWDEGDAISGPLHSPAGTTQQLQRVDNVEIASFAFPDTGSSHSGYFSSKTVMARLFEVIFLGTYSFWPLATDPGRSKEKYDQLYLGPGQVSKRRRGWIVTALAIPWLMLVGIVAYLFGLQTPALWLFGVGVVAIILIALAFWISRKVGQLDPIKPPPAPHNPPPPPTGR